MEVDKKYLDEQFSKLVTKNQFESEISKLVTKDHFENEVSKLATKDALAEQTIELKGYVQEAFETQQEFIDVRFNELIGKMHIREHLKLHEFWIDKIAKKTGVKLGQSS